MRDLYGEKSYSLVGLSCNTFFFDKMIINQTPFIYRKKKTEAETHINYKLQRKGKTFQEATFYFTSILSSLNKWNALEF